MAPEVVGATQTERQSLAGAQQQQRPLAAQQSRGGGGVKLCAPPAEEELAAADSNSAKTSTEPTKTAAKTAAAETMKGADDNNGLVDLGDAVNNSINAASDQPPRPSSSCSRSRLCGGVVVVGAASGSGCELRRKNMAAETKIRQSAQVAEKSVRRRPLLKRSLTMLLAPTNWAHFGWARIARSRADLAGEEACDVSLGLSARRSNGDGETVSSMDGDGDDNGAASRQLPIAPETGSSALGPWKFGSLEQQRRVLDWLERCTKIDSLDTVHSMDLSDDKCAGNEPPEVAGSGGGATRAHKVRMIAQVSDKGLLVG